MAKRAVDPVAIRQELEQTKKDFHKLVASLNESDFKKPSGNKAWTIGDLVAHIASSMRFYASGVESAKKGKGFNPPPFIANKLNVYISKWGARNLTKDKALAQYDQYHDTLLQALSAVQKDDWEKGAKNFGVFQTVHQIFHTVREHLEEHTAQIKAGIKK